MKAKVYVTLKAGVLDPQGKAIQHSVELLGFSGVDDIRQGKYFEIALENSLGETRLAKGHPLCARSLLESNYRRLSRGD